MDTILVAIRIRPLSGEDEPQFSELGKQISLKPHTPVWEPVQNAILNTKTGQAMGFDSVFTEEASNSELFVKLAAPIVENTLMGINATIFAYGQTSSGKTFTMKGSEDHPGLIPLSIDYLFSHLSPDRQFSIKVSYLEVYNEQINDLFDVANTNLNIRIGSAQGMFIDKLTEIPVHNKEELLSLLDRGDANRKVGETSMNVHSSRSHSIFRILIESSDSMTILSSQLNLVDLAGSENIHSSNGQRHKEGLNINKSLLSLSTVIQKLSECPTGFINFRDSKMTRILQPALSGNSKTCIICTINPDIRNYQETNNTLSFGAKAKNIKVDAKVNTRSNSADDIRNRLEEMIASKDMQLNDLDEKLRIFESENAYLKDSIARIEASCTAKEDTFDNQITLESLLIEKEQIIAGLQTEIDSIKVNCAEQIQHSLMENHTLQSDYRIEVLERQIEELNFSLNEAYVLNSTIAKEKEQLEQNFNEISQELQVLMRKNDALMVVELEKQNEVLVSENIDLRNKLANLDRQLELKSDEICEIKNLKEQVENQRNMLEEQLNMASDILDDYDNIKKRDAEYQEICKKSVAHAENLQIELESRKTYIKELEDLLSPQPLEIVNYGSFQVVFSEEDRIKEAFSQLETEHYDLEVAFADIKNNLEHKIEEIEKLKEENSSLESSITDMKTENSNLQIRINTYHNENNKLTHKIEANTQQIATLKELSTAPIYHSYLETLQNSVNEKNKEISQLKKEIKKLDELVRNRDAELSESKRRLSYQKGRNSLMDERALKPITESERYLFVNRVSEAEIKAQEATEELKKIKNI